ncbi:hypothetical protein BCR35DRAFT_79313 [Leucosporidium creatinivorum]|uniref:Uncharacterized protein n=1 Tax=Leucosporidium creatinivorum TaxID=106004 RepID=A0A1Y2FI68_9BASI|nr:hypothetical protein BCR35DRAFT_79313 [Leucosporidium creatinivorum]
MSSGEAHSVHKSSSRGHQNTSNASTSKHTLIDLTEDQDTPTSSPAAKPQKPFHPRLPPPRQPAAPAPTASGSVRVQSQLRLEHNSGFSGRKRSKAWDDAPSQSSSNMPVHRTGQTFQPRDPESKKASTRSSTGSPFGTFDTGSTSARSGPTASSSRAGGRGQTNAQSRVFNFAMQGAQGGQKASTSRSSAASSGQPSSLQKLPPIRRTDQRTENPRKVLLPDTVLPPHDPHADRRSPPRDLNIKGGAGKALKAPRAAAQAASKGKGKAKADIEISSDEEETRGDEGEDPIEDADGPPTSAQRDNRGRSGVDHLRETAPAGDSSPDPLAISGPFVLTGKHAGRGHPPSSRTGEGSSVKEMTAQWEKKTKQPKLSDRLGTRHTPASDLSKKEQDRRANGLGESDNEYGPVAPFKPSAASTSSSKPRKSTASSSSILDLPIEVYSFAEHYAPYKHLNADYRLVYNHSGAVGNHKINICRGTAANTVATFQRSSCDAIEMSANPDAPPLVRFYLKDECQGLGNMIDECGTTPRELDQKSLVWKLVVVFRGHPLGSLDGDSDMGQLWELFQHWGDEPNKIGVRPWSFAAELDVRRAHQAVINRAPEDRPSAQASSGRNVAGSPSTTKRKPRKLLEMSKDGMQQMTLERVLRATFTIAFC